MNSDFPLFSNRDVGQGALALEPGEHTLYCLPLFQERLAFEGVLDSVVGQQPYSGRDAIEQLALPGTYGAQDGGMPGWSNQHQPSDTDEETPQRCGEMTIPTKSVIQIEVLR